MGLDVRKHDDFLKRLDAICYEGDFCKGIVFFPIIEHSIIGEQNLRLDLG